MEKEKSSRKRHPHAAVFSAQFIYDILLTVVIVWLLVQSSGHSSEIQLLKNEVGELRMKQSKCEKIRKSTEDVVDVQKREVLTGTVNINDLLQKGIKGPPGPRGKDGKDGRDGRDAVNLVAVGRHISSSVSNAVDEEMKRVEQIVRSVPTVSGAVYTRYGRTVCPAHSNLVYKGRVGGTFYNKQGGSSQYICLPDDPEFGKPATSSPHMEIISGTEYEHSNTEIFGKQLHDQNVPCAVCEAGVRANKVMIPAKQRCPDDSWTLEYKGLLMTETGKIDNHFRTEFVCVDEKTEAVPGMHTNLNGALLYHTSIDCSTLGHCPPYQTNRELTCVVCSK